MIPTKAAVTVEGQIPAIEEIAFGVSEASVGQVLRSLSRLYSNNTRAAIREYSTNALDANVESGTDKPVEVFLPNQLNPSFKIRDYGPGMSMHVLREVYTRFGESTKRSSNAFNGMLGFGSKSALAYTNSFTITSYHNGMMHTGVVVRNEDEMGGYSISLRMVAVDVPTNEANGVKIEIPVHNVDEFVEEANKFYSYWRKGTVLVNGKMPEISSKLLKIDEDTYAHSSQDEDSIIVMSGVSYPTDATGGFVIYVENGSFGIVPSREALELDSASREKIASLIDDASSKLKDVALQQIESASSHIEAAKIATEWGSRVFRMTYSSVPNGAFFYDGDEFSTEVSGLDGWVWFPEKTRNSTYQANYGRHSVSVDMRMTRSHYYGAPKITEFVGPKFLFITDFTLSNFSTAQRSQVRRWMEANGDYSKVFINTGSTPPKYLWAESKTISWDELKKTTPKKERKSGPGRGADAGKFRIYDSNIDGYVVEHVDSSREILYVENDKEGFSRKINFLNLAVAMPKNAYVVHVPSNRLNKFKRLNPSAKRLKDAIDFAHLRTAKEVLTEEEYSALQADMDVSIGFLRRCSTSILDNIEDEELRTVAKNHRNSKIDMREVRGKLTAAGNVLKEFSEDGSLVRDKDCGVEKKRFHKNYPLIASIYSYGVPDRTLQSGVVEYINLKYKENNK